MMIPRTCKGVQQSRSPYISQGAEGLQSLHAKIRRYRVGRVSFDARTLLVAGAFLCWIFAAMIELLALRRGTNRAGSDAWSIGLFAKGTGLYLISLRGSIEDIWSIAVANGLLLLGLLFFYAALQRVRGAITSRVMISIMPVSLAIALPLIGFSAEAFGTRVLVIMAAWLFGFALSCWSAVQIARAGYWLGASLILAANAAMAALAVAFGAAVFTNEVVGVFTGSDAQLAFYAATDVCIVVSTIGYLIIIRVARDQLRHFDGEDEIRGKELRREKDNADAGA